jgi:hypothetical protein
VRLSHKNQEDLAMTQLVGQPTSGTAVETGDLVTAIQRVLQGSDEPLTSAKIRAALPPALRSQNVEEALQRQVAANVLVEYPKYRSQHARYWDRQMPVHVATLLRQTLEEEPLAWSELRRKLPAYAVERGAEGILQEQVNQGKLFRHPKAGGRGGDRFGARKPDPKDYLRPELVTVFGRLQQFGFSSAQLRAGALELLHEEEWATLPPPEKAAPRTDSKPKSSEQATTDRPQANAPVGSTPPQS